MSMRSDLDIADLKAAVKDQAARIAELAERVEKLESDRTLRLKHKDDQRGR